MKIPALLALVFLPALHAQPPAPSQTPAPHHEANFDAERKQANDLFVAGKVAESLPLYEDLCRQDQTIAVFAERHASGLFQKSATVSDDKARKAMADQGMAEIRRAQSLGDNSPYVQQMLAISAKVNPVSQVISGVPLTVGYTYNGNPQSQAALKEAENAFGHQGYAAAVKLYEKAYTLDPKYYSAALFAGDAYFRIPDMTNAGLWYQKAIDIDPNRETAYRYWGDALYKSGHPAEAKVKFEQAIVAEPYGKTSWLALQQWSTQTKTPVGLPQIPRPNFTTKDGVLQPDPALATDNGDGRSAWLAYETCRVKHGGMSSQPQSIVAGSTDLNGQLHPTGYRHSLEEEHDCLRATLADLRAKQAAGTVTDPQPALKTLLQLNKDGMLDCWIVLNAADAGIRYDYPTYREAHRELLVAYIDRYIIQSKP